MFDVIVLGVGGVGSAALWRLARRGLNVLGIDQFDPPHNQGSSHGATRLIRQAYFEHPSYVPLTQHAYRLWAELEALSGERLFEKTGILQVGPSDGHVLPGVLRSAREHTLPVEQLTSEQVVERWPAFRVPENLSAVYEQNAGFLHVERSVAACRAAAESSGAQVLVNSLVVDWSYDAQCVRVRTEHEEWHAERLIIAGGAWAGGLLKELGLGLTIRRKSLFWFAAPAGHSPSDMPPYLFELPEGVFYGLPAIDDLGVKVGDHSAGTLLGKPEEINREIAPEEEAAVQGFLKQCLPGVSDQRTAHSTCYYTMSPDEHFMVDLHPQSPRVAFAAGLSGHGFKFTPVLGEALANLVMDHATDLPVGFLALNRCNSAS
ncbi:MAG: N-methyl-L-tryptophan oxidase [Planctomycetales bacterium]|nr:N-methyl-L-tryptophan oxidase [Planctomycetales bacterium]